MSCLSGEERQFTGEGPRRKLYTFSICSRLAVFFLFCFLRLVFFYSLSLYSLSLHLSIFATAIIGCCENSCSPLSFPTELPSLPVDRQADRQAADGAVELRRANPALNLICGIPQGCRIGPSRDRSGLPLLFLLPDCICLPLY